MLSREKRRTSSREDELSVLMIGTDPNGRGGIVSLTQLYFANQDLARADITYVTTHRHGSLTAKAWAALTGLSRCILMMVGSRFDVLHALTADRASFFRKALALFVGRRLGLATVFHLHGHSFDRFANDLKRPIRWLVPYILHDTDVVIVSTTEWESRIRRFAPRANIAVLPNGVELSDMSPAVEDDDGLIVSLGQVGQRKGSLDLIRSLPLVRSEHARMILAGDGETADARAEVKRLGLEDRIAIRDWVTSSQREELFRSAACFALPSHAENLPMALLEAMAAGLPVVTTPVGGIPDVVRHLETGILIRPGNVEGLAEALDTVLTDQDLRCRLGKAARGAAEEVFSIESVMGRLGDIWRRAAESARK